jgi:signal peptidase I
VTCWRSAAAVVINIRRNKPQRGDMLVAKNDYSKKKPRRGDMLVVKNNYTEKKPQRGDMLTVSCCDWFRNLF